MNINWEFYRFWAWYHLGLAGVWRRLGYTTWEELFPLSVRWRVLLTALGWLMIRTHNLHWRLGCFVELFRIHPRIRRTDV